MVWLRLLLETDSIFTQPSLASEYKHEWASAVCTAIPHLSVQFVLSLDHLSVPSVLPRRDRFDQFNTALS